MEGLDYARAYLDDLLCLSKGGFLSHLEHVEAILVGVTILEELPFITCFLFIKLSSDPESISTCRGIFCNLIFLAFLNFLPRQLQ